MSLYDDDEDAAPWDFQEDDEEPDQEPIAADVVDQAPPPPRGAREARPGTAEPVQATNVRRVPTQAEEAGKAQLVGLLGVFTAQPVVTAIALGAAGWYLAPPKYRLAAALGGVIAGYALATWVLPRLVAGGKREA